MRHVDLLHKNQLLFICCTIFLISISCKKSQNHSIESTSRLVTSPATAYTLVWSDEFDGTSVNTSNWNFETGGGGWGNNEKEYYQASNASVVNGNLVITAKKQRVKSLRRLLIKNCKETHCLLRM